MDAGVILLHSSAASGRQWQALEAALATRGFAVHAPDLYGHGGTPAWTGGAPLTLDDEVARLAPLIERHERLHLVGHSFGAAVAMRLAALHRRRVCSLVAFEPVCFRELLDAQIDPPGAGSVRALSRELDADLARGSLPEAAQRFVVFWSGRAAWDAMPAAQRESIARRMPSVGRHFGAVFGSRHLVVDVAALAIPRLFLGGAQTVPAARHVAALLRSRIPGALHETLPGMGHLGPITHAGRVDARVLAFLDDAASPRRAAEFPPASTEAFSFIDC